MKALNEIIAQELAQKGLLPFSRFMELALYCPDYGYYEAEKRTVGREGDFFTSVSVGELFGGLLAFQFAHWLEDSSLAPLLNIHLVEAGAHDGKLALDILSWLELRRPYLYARLQYHVIEPSPRRRLWQQETLARFAPQVHWHTHLPSATTQSPPPNARTLIFSNELLDAFPVRRLGWDSRKQQWFEWGVALEKESFVWAKLPHLESSPFLLEPGLLEVLPDDFTTEICPAAEAWWSQAAQCLPAGKLLTFDYGLEAADFFTPQRRHGTLRSYRRHQIGDPLLACPGEQDLTAQVNFTALQKAGESAGLKTEALITQSQFLTQIAEKIWRKPAAFGEWTPRHTRQFQTLTHPQHLGRAFRTLVQSR